MPLGSEILSNGKNSPIPIFNPAGHLGIPSNGRIIPTVISGRRNN